MGAMQNNERTPAKRSGKRGSVRNGDRLQAFANGRGKGMADWGGCDPSKLQAVLVGITTLGGAVTFGLSRDEGAYSLTLLLDNNKQTMWYNGDDDLNEKLDEVVATLDTLH